jgi:hypothetical protein
VIMHAHMNPLLKEALAMRKNPVRSGEFEDRDAFWRVPTSTQLFLHHSKVDQHAICSSLILYESPGDRVIEQNARCHPALKTLRKIVICQRASVITSPNIGEDEPGWVESFRLEMGLRAFPGYFLGQSKTNDVH